MTRLAIISDPHSNFEALSEVLADIETYAVDESICMGDAIG